MAPIAAIRAPGNLRRKLLESDDDHQYSERDRQRVPVDLSELSKVAPELSQRAVAARIQAQHAGNLPQRDLNADPGEKPYQHRTRETVGQETHGIRHATIKKPAVINASTPANATYCSGPVAAIPTRALARMAAVAESAPTTRCREERNTANNAVGMSMVYDMWADYHTVSDNPTTT